MMLYIIISIFIFDNWYGYANKQNDKKLGKQNNKVPRRAYRNKPLTKQQKQDNRQRSSIRYIVERTFWLIKALSWLRQSETPWHREKQD